MPLTLLHHGLQTNKVGPRLLGCIAWRCPNDELVDMSLRLFEGTCRSMTADFSSRCGLSHFAQIMAGGIGLREVKQCSDDSFQSLWDGAGDHILFEYLDDGGQPQGYAVARIMTQYHGDKDGGFLKLEYVAASDEYYQHWITSEGGSGQYHHVCRKSLGACRRKVGESGVVHIQKLAFVTSADVDSIVKEWKAKRLDKGPPVGRGTAPVNSRGRPGDHLTTASKRKAKRPLSYEERSLRRPEQNQDFGSEDSKDERDQDAGRSNARRRRRRRHSSRSPRCRPEEARGRVGEFSRKRQEATKPSPLDAMLGDDLEDPLQNDSRLEQLRASLEDRKKKPEEKTSASAVLVQRVQDGLERNAQKKKKSSEQEKVTKALQVLRGKKNQEESSSLKMMSCR